MGLVINPTAFRIGHVKAWTDAWYLHRMHYPVFVHKSLEIKTLLQYILLNRYPSQWSHWVYSHITYYFFNNKFFVSLFIYDGNDPHGYFMLAKDHKYGWFKKSKFNRFWTKKQLLDLQFFYQRWYLLCQVMNLDFEDLQLDSLKWRVKKRELRKISNLRRKYGSTWVAREELFIWKFPISMVSSESYNKMGVKMLNLLYKLFIMPKIRSAFRSKDFDLVDTAHTVVKSHKIFYFFFSYIDRILKIIPSYPVGLFNRWTHKAAYKFFRMYFVFKPYWINLSKLYELILLYINVNSKIKVYLLDNIHLNATYLARYIMTCLRLKFDYRDTMIPIKKTLLKIMFAKRWRPIKDLKKKGWQLYLERYKNLLKDRIKFHLVTSDVLKMFLYRFKLVKKMRRMFKKPIYKRFSMFNFSSLKKNLVFLYKIKFNNNIEFCKNFIWFRHLNLFKHLKISGMLLKNKFRILILKNFVKEFKMELLKNAKYLYFNKKNIKNNNIFKLTLKNLIKKNNFLKYFKNLFYLKKKIFKIKLKKIIFLKNSIISFFFLDEFSCYLSDYIVELKKMFSEKFSRLGIKTLYWMRRRKRLKRRLHTVAKRNYKRQYKIKLEGDFVMLKHRVKWPYAKRWIRGRKKLFQLLKKKFVKFKNIVLNLNFDLFRYTESKDFIFFFIDSSFYKQEFVRYIKYDKFIVNFKKNLLYFYDKNFKAKYLNVFLRADIQRGFSNLFFFYLLVQHSFRYKPFAFNINLYRNYISNVLNLPDVNSHFVQKKLKKHNLEEMPLKDKFKRLRILEGGTRSLLYGYKFHFVGRFTRKQKAASLWFAKGANSVSSMRVDIDYGFHTIALRYSTCTLKVWLYRNRGYSFKYGYRLV